MDKRNLPKATVYVAKEFSEHRDAVCAAAGAAGFEARPIQSVDEVPHEIKGQPACVVSDLPTIYNTGPKIVDQLIVSKVDPGEKLDEPKTDTRTLVMAATFFRDADCVFGSGGLSFLHPPFSRQQLLDAIQRAVECDKKYLKRLKSRQKVKALVEGLTEREHQVMRMIYDGLPNKVMAAKLSVSMRTVESIRSKVFENMGVESAVDLTRILAESDWFDESDQ